MRWMRATHVLCHRHRDITGDSEESGQLIAFTACRKLEKSVCSYAARAQTTMCSARGDYRNNGAVGNSEALAKSGG